MQRPILVSLLGIGAARIETDERAILIDAFNDYNEIPALKKDDLILFTHSDGDHFSADALMKSVFKDHLLIGPPSIAYNLWKTERVNIENVKVFYPNEREKSESITSGNIEINIYNTEHFLQWHNSHISFLIKIGGKKIFFTGDSEIPNELEKELNEIDCLICNLLNGDIVKEKIDRKYGKYFDVVKLLEIKSRLNPKLIIGNHLIQCNWASNPEELAEIINSEKIDHIKIPTMVSERIEI